jgi:hypothetical protein
LVERKFGGKCPATVNTNETREDGVRNTVRFFPSMDLNLWRGFLILCGPSQVDKRQDFFRHRISGKVANVTSEQPKLVKLRPDANSGNIISVFAQYSSKNDSSSKPTNLSSKLDHPLNTKHRSRGSNGVSRSLRQEGESHVDWNRLRSG